MPIISRRILEDFIEKRQKTGGCRRSKQTALGVKSVLTASLHDEFFLCNTVESCNVFSKKRKMITPIRRTLRMTVKGYKTRKKFIGRKAQRFSSYVCHGTLW